MLETGIHLVDADRRPWLFVDAASQDFHTGNMLSFTFKAALWLYKGKGAWHFVTLPENAAAEIRFFSPQARGFMPIPVKATIGATTWKTSVFPDSKSGSYLLAVKTEVRKKEGIAAGDEVEVKVVVEGGV